MSRSQHDELHRRRQAQALRFLKEAREARERLDLAEQQRAARVASDTMHRPRDDTSRALFARALHIEVDALLNRDRIGEAAARAQEGHSVVRFRRRRPERGGVEAYATMLLTHELGGDPSFAAAAFADLARSLTAHGGHDLACLRAHQHAMTSALRAEEHGYLVIVRRLGDPLAWRLVEKHPDAVAYWWHWRAIADAVSPPRNTIPGAGERAAMLDFSLANRPATPRDRRTRGMGEAERLLALGRRTEAVELFRATVAAFLPDLPRHHRSATTRLVMRGLSA